MTCACCYSKQIAVVVFQAAVYERQKTRLTVFKFEALVLEEGIIAIYTDARTTVEAISYEVTSFEIFVFDNAM